ncbi:MAG: hypothetical protein LBC41_11275, partial [Clostridiales bacterium]|nr:hypothetical protein [Clostridiales bacterium]
FCKAQEASVRIVGWYCDYLLVHKFTSRMQAKRIWPVFSETLLQGASSALISPSANIYGNNGELYYALRYGIAGLFGNGFRAIPSLTLYYKLAGLN